MQPSGLAGQILKRWIGGWSLVVVMVALSMSATASQPPADRDERATTLTPEQIVQEQIERLPLQPLQDFVGTLDTEVQDVMPPLDIRRMIFEGDGIQWGLMGRRLLDVFIREVMVNISLLGQLVILGVFCAFLRIIASSMAGDGAGDAAIMLSLLVLLLIGLHAFRTAVELAGAAIDQMVGFMQAILPVLSTMLAAVGAVTTAAIFHPLIYATVTAIATLMQSVLFPIVYLLGALAVIGSISKEFPIGKLEGLFKTGTVAALTLSFLVFFGVLQVRGAIAPVVDGFAIRTAKFLTGAFVPVIGGKLADALDVIVGGSVLIKNAVGVFGMTTVGAITAFPIVKVFSILAIFRVATALIEPIADPRLVQAMSGLAGGLALLLAGLITVALMFFVAITVVISVGNAAAVMR